MLRHVWATGLASLFPSRCVGCGRRDTDLCDACRSNLLRLPDRRCPHCAAPAGRLGVCDRCRTHRVYLDSIRVDLAFDGPLRKAIHLLKYRHGTYLIPMLRDLALESIRARPLRPDAIVPVPIGPRRLRERGYNQSILLAEAIGSALNLPVMVALDRVKEGPSQTRLNVSERRANVRDAFAVRRDLDPDGLRLLLIDDVMTTGATLDACARALKRAGAARVFGLAVAREV
ncbi:MAG: ComF family protein [Chloroflexota bacterium]